MYVLFVGYINLVTAIQYRTMYVVHRLHVLMLHRDFHLALLVTHIGAEIILCIIVIFVFIKKTFVKLVVIY